jgi:small basic protein
MAVPHSCHIVTNFTDYISLMVLGQFSDICGAIRATVPQLVYSYAQEE